MHGIVYLAQQLPVDGVSTIATTGGVIGLLSLIVTAFIRGWIVTGQAYRDMRLERDDYKKIAFELSNISRGSLNMAREQGRWGPDAGSR